MTDQFDEIDEILSSANEPKDITEVGPYKVSAPYSDSRNTFFTDLAKRLPPPKERKTYTKEEIIAMQPASTQRLMKMTDEEHAKFHNTPIDPEKAYANYDAIKKFQTTGDESALDEAIPARKLTERERENYQLHRKTSKNTQHQFDEGHGNLKATSNSSAGPERKTAAKEAFRY